MCEVFLGGNTWEVFVPYTLLDSSYHTLSLKKSINRLLLPYLDLSWSIHASQRLHSSKAFTQHRGRLIIFNPTAIFLTDHISEDYRYSTAISMETFLMTFSLQSHQFHPLHTTILTSLSLVSTTIYPTYPHNLYFPIICQCMNFSNTLY